MKRREPLELGAALAPIAETSAGRQFALPGFPAIAETVPGYVAMSWQEVAFPAGTPGAIAIRASGARVE